MKTEYITYYLSDIPKKLVKLSYHSIGYNIIRNNLPYEIYEYNMYIKPFPNVEIFVSDSYLHEYLKDCKYIYKIEQGDKELYLLEHIFDNFFTSPFYDFISEHDIDIFQPFNLYQINRNNIKKCFYNS